MLLPNRGLRALPACFELEKEGITAAVISDVVGWESVGGDLESEPGAPGSLGGGGLLDSFPAENWEPAVEVYCSAAGGGFLV